MVTLARKVTCRRFPPYHVRRHARRPRAEHRLTRKMYTSAVHLNGGPKSSCANWQPRPKLIPALKLSPPKPAVLASTPPTSNRNSGTGGNRRRPESFSGGPSPVDTAMGEESADSDSAGMDVDPQPPASKRGRRSQGKEQTLRCPERSEAIMARGA